jgi:hypothetical protein
MCRCSIKRKYILIWTPESEMKETISRVEKHSEELEYDSNSAKTDATTSHKTPLEDAVSSTKDRLIHQTYEVPVGPIFPINSVPQLVSSTQGNCSVTVKDLPEAEIKIQDFDRSAVLTPDVDSKIQVT